MMQQMQRDQSDMDMNGNRAQSPASTDNAPSPSKRPRLEGGPVNGQQLAPNGRGQGQGQGMQGQPNPQAQAMMMQNGMNRGINPAQFQQFQQGQAAQQKSMQVYAQNLALHHSRSASNSQGLPNGGMMNPGVMPNQTDLVTMPDGNGGMYPVGPDYYQGNGQMAQVRPGGMQTPNGQHGNHALQDYQMQLMLLEQQNKRRLMMARQEQDSMARDGQPIPGQGQLPPGTSPQGSRTGASPNPSEQMKRGTPKMPQSGLPGSPSAGDMGQNRGSPGSMNLNGQMPPEMAAQFFPGGPHMRPPSSNPAFTGPQMGQPIPAGVGRMPSGQWQPGQPMPPQHSPASQPQAGTPQERGAMPPPQAPPAGPNAGRTQPPSPQTTGNAPPTPQQGNKPAPKGKKEGAKETNRKRPKKGANAAAAAANAANAAAAEAGEAAQTPTPSTPVTPQHPNSFNKTGANAAANAPPQPTSAPAPPTMVQPTPDPNSQPFNDLGINDVSADGGILMFLTSNI